ncbi:MAG: apolipoprotein N-acyltransferase [Actinomycetota bacterium]|nr:apolipoprotein N-acyltransferase [Actinomycetota bacterium]
MRGQLVSAPIGVLLAIAAGFCFYLAFPPIEVGALAPIGVLLLTIALFRASLKRGFALALLTGFVYFLPLISWMATPGVDAWLLLTLLCALWVALMGTGIAAVTRLPGWPIWVASLWVIQEALRGTVPWGGFAWGDLAFAQAGTWLGGYAALIGRPGVTFAVALAGTSLLAAVLAIRGGRRVIGGAWAAIFLLVLVIGLVLPLGIGTTSQRSVAIAVVQGGTPQLGLSAMDVRRQVLDNHVAQTLLLAEQVRTGQVEQPVFVLWPENSTDIDPFQDPTVAADITRAAVAINAPILVGAVVAVPDNPMAAWNVGVVWDPVTGPGARYIKNHPVPFGEYVPLRAELAPILGRFDQIPRDFLAGDKPGLLAIGGVLAGDVICFEVSDDQVMNALVVGGAEVITVQTNNATFGGSAQPEQQLQIERLRAIETGRTVVVAATTGVSAFITPDGVVQSAMQQGQVGSLVVPVALVDGRTIAGHLGKLPELLLAVLGIAALAMGVILRVRHRGRREAEHRLGK